MNAPTAKPPKDKTRYRWVDTIRKDHRGGLYKAFILNNPPGTHWFGLASVLGPDDALYVYARIGPARKTKGLK